MERLWEPSGPGTTWRRRLPVGAEVGPDGVHVRVWAPGRKRVEVVLEAGLAGAPVPLSPEEGDGGEEGETTGYFSGWVHEAGVGSRYRLRVDGQTIPDPFSRFQPEGPHGPSMVVDPDAFAWTDSGWRGVGREGQVLYEMHVGTFTPEGTWQAAARELEWLADLGISVIELMPVCEFPGRFGWGYDGVQLFAPTRLYGAPDDLRAFVDHAHRLGIGVILDVVYNHFGPDGNYLRVLSDRWFGDERSEWGDSPNFDGPLCGPVREVYAANAAYWIDEFHMDGLRLDATQQIFDRSARHIVADVVERAREAAGERSVFIVAENEPQQARYARRLDHGGGHGADGGGSGDGRESGGGSVGIGGEGIGCDALWSDDFHHAARVAMTGRAEAYFSDYQGSPQELVSAVVRGFLFQGQRCAWQDKPRGTPAGDLPPEAFVHYLQNHDQVANTSCGARLHRLTSPGRLRAMTAVLLLGPQTPLLFQGQEHAASSPFLYFADHQGELGRQVREGRARFVSQFPSTAAHLDALPDPADEATFRRSKLDPRERDLPGHAEVVRLHKDLLRLRREDPVLRAPRRGGVAGAVLGPEAFVLRFPGGPHGDRLLVVNLGRDLILPGVAEPLLAPPEGGRWQLVWSSEDLAYGGSGAPPHDDARGWRLVGHAAALLAPAGAALPG